MCGICGFWGFQDSQLMDRMLKKMEHRGPDGKGAFTSDCGNVSLGHRRLSIIDLTERGAQPIKSGDGNAVLSFNGEIYNYKILKAELEKLGHNFLSDSDSEVLLIAYQAWGYKCLERIKGMFAFAIWDSSNKLLFCARDRFGIKPFYYYINEKSGIFASEIKAILEYRGYTPVVNLSVAYDYLKHGMLEHSNDTFFEGIKKLPPGHYMTVINGEAKFEQYWELPCGDFTHDRDTQSEVEVFRSLFIESLREHTISDVTVGSCLSGGLDSSTIVSSIVSEQLIDREKFKTISYVAELKQHDESNFIDDCVKYSDLLNYKVTLTPEDIPTMVRDIVYYQEEPFGSTGIFLQWAVMKKAHDQEVKVLLDGQGADEILAGYRKYRLYKIKELVSAGRMIPAIKLFISSLAQFKSSLSLKNDWRKISKTLLRKSDETKDYIKIKPSVSRENYTPANISTIREASYYDLTQLSLPPLLRYEDKNSMAHSIEARVPFLDHQFVEYVYSLSGELKLKNGVSKWIMREAFRKELPPSIYQRQDKMGFVPSEDYWLSRNKEWFIEQMKKNQVQLEEFIDIQGLLNDHDKLFSFSLDHNLWRYINFALWYDTFFVREQ